MIDRYTDIQMKEIWSEKIKYQHMLEVELACLEAWNRLGVIPEKDVTIIKKNAKFSVERIHELEDITKHDVIAFTRCVDENLGEEKKWFHYGLTSTDVVDTANAITLKKVNLLIRGQLKNFIDVLKQKALIYENTPCIGRTHGMHAEVTSFGLKWALWYDEMVRNLNRFNHVCQNIEVGKISGAVGNFANTPPFIEEYVCKQLKINYANISTQVLSRDRHSAYIYVLAMIATTIEKIAIEVRHLSRTEVDEVEEGFSSGQKGSSAMPHKKNPIASENMCGCARIIRGYINPALENNLLWHERDISHSSGERIMLADITTLIHYMLKRYANVLDNLVVNKDKMYTNIYMTKGIIFSGRVLNALINKGLSREDAYDLVQHEAIKCQEKANLFSEQLINSSIVNYLSKDEIEETFDINYYLKEVDYIYKRLGLKEYL